MSKNRPARFGVRISKESEKMLRDLSEKYETTLSGFMNFIIEESSEGRIKIDAARLKSQFPTESKSRALRWKSLTDSVVTIINRLGGACTPAEFLHYCTEHDEPISSRQLDAVVKDKKVFDRTEHFISLLKPAKNSVRRTANV